MRRPPTPAWLLAVALLAAGCAKSVFPPGGPVDTIPPRILASAPADSSIRVPLDAGVELLFSEGMERNSVRDGLRVYPPPGEPSFHWSGRRLRVTWSEPLLAGSTYQVFLSASARDLHQVALGHPFTLRFATGDSLDPGAIPGRLRARTLATQGVPILAYPESSGLPPDFEQAAAYATETDTAGTFRFTGLPLDRGFTVHALYDLNRNGSFEPDADVVASAPVAIRLTRAHPVADSVRLAAVDPRAPALVSGTIASADSIARFRVEARSDSDSVRVAHVQRRGPGEYLLRVPPGRYRLIAIRVAGAEPRDRALEIGAPELLEARAEEEYPGRNFDFRSLEESVPPGAPPGGEAPEPETEE